MQRPDAYTAPEKLTKPVWLAILGVGLLSPIVPRHHSAPRSRHVAAGVYLVDVRPKIAGNPGKVAIVPVRIESSRPRWRPLVSRLAFASPASANPVPSPPYVDHVEWAKWGDLSSLRVYPTEAGRLAAGRHRCRRPTRRGPRC